MFLFGTGWGACSFALVVSTSGCDLHSHSWQSQGLASELPLIPEGSWRFSCPPCAGPKNVAVPSWPYHTGLLLPLHFGKGYSPIGSFVPGSHMHFVVQTQSSAVVSARKPQETSHLLIPSPWMCIRFIFQLTVCICG